MKRAVLLALVCILLTVTLPSVNDARLSENSYVQTTLSEQEYEVIYGDVNLTVDAWEDNPMVFYSDEQVWNGYDWDAPIYWQLYWNSTSQSLNPPPLEYQYRGGDFFLETDANSTYWISMRPNWWAEDYYDFYSGPTLNFTGFATNAVVINCSYHEYVWNMTAHAVPEHWNVSGWYFMGVTGHSWFKYNETHYFDGNLHEMRLFYFNITEPVQEPEPPAPVPMIEICNFNTYPNDSRVNTGDVIHMDFDIRWSDTWEPVNDATVYLIDRENDFIINAEFMFNGIYTLWLYEDNPTLREFEVFDVFWVGEHNDTVYDTENNLDWSQTEAIPTMIWDSVQVDTGTTTTTTQRNMGDDVIDPAQELIDLAIQNPLLTGIGIVAVVVILLIYFERKTQ